MNTECTPLTRRVYADWAAATPLRPEVLERMGEIALQEYGNPSARYTEGFSARDVLEDARRMCADILNAHPDECIFTSGGTEANNLCIMGVFEARARTGVAWDDMQYVLPATEHQSLLACAEELARRGVVVTFLPVTFEGIASPESLRDALTKKTVLVSASLVNSEIGSIAPLAAYAKVIRRHNAAQGTSVLLHCDMSQATLFLEVSVHTHHTDLATLDGAKIGGPKGVGLAYVRRSVPLAPILYGGEQERGMRPGTPAVPLIAGFAKALALASEERESETHRVTVIRDVLINHLLTAIPFVIINGPLGAARVANNVNISIPDVDTELVSLRLDVRGIACATKSPCTGGASSHVIAALRGGDTTLPTSALRFTFGKTSTMEDAHTITNALVDALRVCAPRLTNI